MEHRTSLVHLAQLLEVWLSHDARYQLHGSSQGDLLRRPLHRRDRSLVVHVRRLEGGGARRHHLRRPEEEEADRSALVPPHDRPALLLGELRRGAWPRPTLRHYEHVRAHADVRLLRNHGLAPGPDTALGEQGADVTAAVTDGGWAGR